MQSHIVKAHDNAINHLTLSADGTLLATAVIIFYDIYSLPKLSSIMFLFLRANAAHVSVYLMLAMETNSMTTAEVSSSSIGTWIFFLEEFFAGSAPAEIQCLAFSADNRALAVSSDHGTVHFFFLDAENTKS